MLKNSKFLICFNEILFKLITEMFYRFRFSDCFESEFQRIRPLVGIAWLEKDFLLLVRLKSLTCLVG